MVKEIDLLMIQNTFTKDRANLLDDIRREKANLDAYSDENPDMFDLADRCLNQEISQKRLDHMEKWLEQIEISLKRVHEGTYGICANCGKPINPERLEAMPAAVYCIECQQEQEGRSY